MSRQPANERPSASQEGEAQVIPFAGRSGPPTIILSCEQQAEQKAGNPARPASIFRAAAVAVLTTAIFGALVGACLLWFSTVALITATLVVGAIMRRTLGGEPQRASGFRLQTVSLPER